MKYDENKIYTVSEYIEVLNIGLKSFKLKMTGEISGVKLATSGHAYFSLKDEGGGAIIDCVIWRSNYRLFGTKLEDGMQVVLTGNSHIYAPSGRLSFVAETIELTGEGALKKEYDKLKARLEAEGLFEESRKRPIPKYPHKIGVITSLRSGVVIADFGNNLGKFGFHVRMMDARVEGQEAVKSLLSAIKAFKKQDIELLVIMRGGGSLESLIAFNNEVLAREVAEFPVPVIAAIGHDVDVPLMALVADKGVSTPTAAANLISSSWEEASFLLEKYERDILGQYERVLGDADSLIAESLNVIYGAGNMIGKKYRDSFARLMISMQKFKTTIKGIESDLSHALDRITSTFDARIIRSGQSIGYMEKVIASNNPERQLRLGYSIATCGGKVVRSTKDVAIGLEMNIKVSDGIINSEVKNINKE